MTMKLDLKWLMRDSDRHGNARLYVRKNGRKIRLREAPGTEDFARAYTEALEALSRPGKNDRSTPAHGTLGWLVATYFHSAEFKGLATRSQATRRRILDECLKEPRKPGSMDIMSACPVSRLSAAHVQMLRDRKQGLPGAANNRIKYLSAMFGWAVEKRLMTGNPARDARPVRYATSGFYTWTIEDVQKYEARHPIGTKARLAFALLMYTGSRLGDVVTFGKQHTKDGWLRFVPRKTRYKRMKLSEKPILSQLQRVINASKTGELTFLMTEYGKPFTDAGFGGWFRKRCNEAGLPQCSAHGIRKAAATRAAEEGATDRQLMALFDWTTASQASIYTAAASQKRLTGEAMKLIAGDQTENLECPTAMPHRETGH